MSRSSGEAARDAGIGRVLSPNRLWLDQGIKEAAQRIPIGWRGTGEDIRLVVEPYIGEPTHHNAWGGFVRAVTSHTAALFEPTGDFAQSKRTARHANVVPEYMRVPDDTGRQSQATGEQGFSYTR